MVELPNSPIDEIQITVLKTSTYSYINKLMFQTLLLFMADKPDSDLSKKAFLRCPIGPNIHKWVGSIFSSGREVCMYFD